MRQEIIDKLYEPFELRQRPGQGKKTFEYVPSEDILDRMNRAFEGNWSTKVVFHEVNDDNVLMLVEVSAEDPKTGRVYAHDGWASHPIMRYTEGYNKGKIIDLGNAYKAAMSKAIKTAVSRWGVDLKREESSHSFTGAMPVSSGPAPKKTEAPVSGPPTQGFPPTTAAESKPAAPANKVPPVFTDNNVITEPKPAPTEEKPPMLTDVQRVAIEHIMEVNGLSLEDLGKVALGRETNIPTELDNVTYPDAVAMISHGNALSLQ